MPWKEEGVESQRGRFVLKALDEGANISELCREFGITRPTGYKWLLRYERGGIRALEDESRCPRRFAITTRADVVAAIVRLRTEHASWGSRKIRKCLIREGLFGDIPVARTIDRILKRCGLVSVKNTRKRVELPEIEIVQPTRANQVWTIDFKGWWCTQDGKRCEPLTIRDEYSRFIIGIFALNRTTYSAVKSCLIECFKKYGIPDYIRCDNGSPFASTRSLCGLTRLSVWWLKLGITPNRIKVATPSMNGAHERMHLDMKKELQRNPAQNRNAEQKRFDRWRHDFNHLRPHESLKDDVPALWYRSSARGYPTKTTYYQYPVDFVTRRVSRDGQISWRNRIVRISKALAGENIGIQIVNDATARIWYTDYVLGLSDPELKTPITHATIPLKKDILLRAA